MEGRSQRYQPTKARVTEISVPHSEDNQLRGKGRDPSMKGVVISSEQEGLQGGVDLSIDGIRNSVASVGLDHRDVEASTGAIKSGDIDPCKSFKG